MTSSSTYLTLLVALAFASCRVDSEVGSNALEAHDARPPVDSRPINQCLDHVDNDGDGLTDFPFDPGCQGYNDTDEDDPLEPPACSNQIDDDEDAVIDFPLELGCTAASDDDETDPPSLPECADGLDNESNGSADYPDVVDGCYAAGDPRESSITS